MASRRTSEQLVFQGKVTVNGSVCNAPQVTYLAQLRVRFFFSFIFQFRFLNQLQLLYKVLSLMKYIINIGVTFGQTKVDPARDIIYVNGNRLPKKLPPKVYLALNKPKGFVFSTSFLFIVLLQIMCLLRICV